MTNARIQTDYLLRAAVGAVSSPTAPEALVFGNERRDRRLRPDGSAVSRDHRTLVALLEFFGGIALVVGLLTRPAALGLAVNMMGAMVLVHAPNGFFLPNGIEFTLLLGSASLALAIMGAGELSVDAWLAHRRQQLPHTAPAGRTLHA